MRWRTSAVTAGSLAATLLMACDPGQGFCPADPVVCTGDGCGDAGTTGDCITFEQAAALAKAGTRGVHQLSTSVAPSLWGFVGTTATDSRSICKQDTCYLFSDGSVLLHAVPETQALFVGWSG